MNKPTYNPSSLVMLRATGFLHFVIHYYEENTFQKLNPFPSMGKKIGNGGQKETQFQNHHILFTVLDTGHSPEILSIKSYH
jgi:hypothetical protein